MGSPLAYASHPLCKKGLTFDKTFFDFSETI